MLSVRAAAWKGRRFNPMKKMSLKIKYQLAIGYAIILALVVTLGLVSHFETDRLYRQAQTLYEHPLQVKQAVSQLEIDILNTRVGIRDFLLTQDEAEKESALRTMAASLEDGEVQFETIYALYLGPKENIDAAYSAYNDWRGATEYRASEAQHDGITTQDLGDDTTVGQYRLKLTAALQVIKDFANGKASSLYQEFIDLNNLVNIQLFILMGAVLALTVFVGNRLARALRVPIHELNDGIARFHKGDLGARSGYDRDDEFGALSSSFNAMADSIEENMNLHKKTGAITEVMLVTEDSHEFFRRTLGALSAETGANMAAAYLYNAGKKTFDHYESIGISGPAKESFDAEGLEGLFGPAALSGEVQFVREIPSDTGFVFQSPCCKFPPREIITIPIISGHRTIAVISLACVGTFREGAEELVREILPTMSARIEGVLASRTIRRFTEQLEGQNRELEAQGRELSVQAGELARQNTELEMQKKQLQEASRLKTSFLSTMSHELRTPLNSIIALSGVLGRRLHSKIPDEEYGYLDVIERNGKSLLLLINEILDISRIEAGREEIEVSEFSINETVLEVASVIWPQADQKGIKLQTDTKGKDVRITSDAGKCRHILQNIIGNAVKFTDKGGVEISLTGREDRVEISVTDTGVGIAPEHLGHIFDEFRQADGGTARRYGGTGLGLSIAQKYAQMLGGSISVKSAPGRGSAFTLTLPLQYTEPAAETVEEEEAGRDTAPDEAAAPKRQKTLLLIEDSEPQVIQIKDLLRESGHRILAANSADQAFEILKTESADAIVLDLMMPGTDGFETLQVLRESPATRKTPVLILTAKHITKDELKILKANHIYQLIRKGDVDGDELIKSISAMLQPSKKKEAPAQKAAAGRPLILVVEDNPDNMITAKALLSHKYRVIGAVDGEEGVAAAKKHVPDLILMDIELPGISGVEAFEQIRRIPALISVPVIALTASVMEGEREAVLAHGFEAFIPKPIVEAEFLRVIGEVLYGR